MTESEFIYENEGFFVDIEMDGGPLLRDGAQYSDYYIVINKTYGIVEFKTPSLVEAISGAAMAQATLEGAPWKFYGLKADKALPHLLDDVPPTGTMQ
jgi:hypothetical protein